MYRTTVIFQVFSSISTIARNARNSGFFMRSNPYRLLPVSVPLSPLTSPFLLLPPMPNPVVENPPSPRYGPLAGSSCRTGRMPRFGVLGGNSCRTGEGAPIRSYRGQFPTYGEDVRMSAQKFLAMIPEVRRPTIIATAYALTLFPRKLQAISSSGSGMSCVGIVIFLPLNTWPSMS